jgi:glycosyltransferase involved in cell wall biosynthesis
LKGIDFLMREMQAMPKDKYELFVAGPGRTAYTDELRKRDFGMPVHWMGFTQPEEFFPLIDMLIVPSLWQEPFGRVIVEAYSYGLPVLASRVGGIPEIIDENVTGFLFDPYIEGDFRKKLSAITPKILQAMRPACLEKLHTFDPDNIGRQYLEVFSSVLGK